MGAKNKVKFGLKNVHYAMLTTEEDGTISYGVPVAFPGAVSLSLQAQGDTSTFYADDIAYYVTASNDGYQGDLEAALVPDSFRVDALGETSDPTDKVLIENAAAEGNPFALLFEFSADQKAVRHVLYHCVAARPNVAGQTRTNAKTPATETITLTASPLADGSVKAKTTAETTESVYNGWYKSVWQPGKGT